MKTLTSIAMAAFVVGCMPDNTPAFDRPALLDAASPSYETYLRQADRHILVVRHARKTAPDCNALDCQLSPRGEAMVARLAELTGEVPFDAAYASAACRTVLTARAGGVDVVPHQAADGLETGCEADDVITRTRAEAFEEALESDARWTIVGEHSNTVCQWLQEVRGPDSQDIANCVDGRLDHNSYGNIYWLFRRNGYAWGMVVIEDAFTAPEES
ncbi:MAG: histidine phosphatase family protein [Maricaulis sp.]|nr:histidine phosphatase family protein [Maricaulis sp.]MDG2044735.1 histidine phosphatase family protein [Maricaulis sp.]